jgi:hypothetical protein
MESVIHRTWIPLIRSGKVGFSEMGCKYEIPKAMFTWHVDG